MTFRCALTSQLHAQAETQTQICVLREQLLLAQPPPTLPFLFTISKNNLLPQAPAPHHCQSSGPKRRGLCPIQTAVSNAFFRNLTTGQGGFEAAPKHHSVAVPRSRDTNAAGQSTVSTMPRPTIYAYQRAGWRHRLQSCHHPVPMFSVPSGDQFGGPVPRERPVCRR